MPCATTRRAGGDLRLSGEEGIRGPDGSLDHMFEPLGDHEEIVFRVASNHTRSTSLQVAHDAPFAAPEIEESDAGSKLQTHE